MSVPSRRRPALLCAPAAIEQDVKPIPGTPASARKQPGDTIAEWGRTVKVVKIERQR